MAYPKEFFDLQIYFARFAGLLRGTSKSPVRNPS